MLVFGTRPEVVKLAPVARALRDAIGSLAVRLVVTGQHRELLDQMLSVFSLDADIDLNLMRKNQRLCDFFGRAVRQLGGVFREEMPSMILVQGDTSTVFAATLAAFYEGIPVGHVEAGLRSFDMTQPFPEEANRALTGRIASLHFAPTEQARQNLLGEGVASDCVHVTGNPVVDSLKLMAPLLKKRKPKGPLQRILSRRRRRVTITLHRRENHGAPLERICGAIRRVAQEYSGVDFVYPVHPNPNVRVAVERVFRDISNVHLIDALDYLDFTCLLSRSALTITDSGGVQEEAPSFGVPVLVARETTERPEGLSAGCAELVGSDEELIYSRICALLDEGPKKRGTKNPYGDGLAGQRIAKHVASYLNAL